MMAFNKPFLFAEERDYWIITDWHDVHVFGVLVTVDKTAYDVT